MIIYGSDPTFGFGAAELKLAKSKRAKFIRFFYFTVNCSVQVSTKTWFPLPKYLSKEVRDFVTSWFKHTAAAAAAATTTADTAVSTSITAVITTTSG